MESAICLIAKWKNIMSAFILNRKIIVKFKYNEKYKYI